MTTNPEELYLEIVRMGHPLLRDTADPIPSTAFGTPALRAFTERLLYTMMYAEGVGLAAPQVAEGLRCFAYYVPADREPELDEEEGMLVQPTVLINPQFKPLSSHKADGWEGCLSIPGLRGIVPRFTHIEVEALDVEGNVLRFEAEDFHARVIQHEYDHLDGVLFLDRMEHMKSLAFEEEWMIHTLGVPEDEIYGDFEEED